MVTSLTSFSQSNNKMPSSCVSDATICCWSGFNCGDCKFGLGGKSECLCLVEECCLAVGEDSLGCGMVTNEDNKECCKIGLMGIACGLKSPEVLCTQAQYFCCMEGAASFPFTKGYVESFSCAVCFLSCAPDAGCCVEAKEATALRRPLKDYSYKVEGQAMNR
mmetsp:Transcript_5239/g.8011  ORF Transcript_5239/g.8011 Transcript_5239/m.8011 type:complete len:163 (+) Transcript_5239:241-729(+)